MLNYKLLIVCVCIVIVISLYLFFWNRFVGYILGRLFRLWFWNQGESSVWLDIGSIHFSLLTGRILFKDLHYHSSNQTIRVVKGQISWRYWIRVPAGEEDLSHARVMGEDTGLKTEKKAALSCRLHLSMQGLEWFIYNRTAAYDSIVNAMDSTTNDPGENTNIRPSADGISSLRKIFSWSSAVPDPIRMGPPVSLVSSIITWTPGVVKKSLAWGRGQLPNLDPKELLPISIDVTKAAIVIGNAATPTLLVTEFQRSEGTYGVVSSRSKYDLYKHVMNLIFQNASLCYVDNPDYDGNIVSTGEKLHENIRRSHARPLRAFSYLSFGAFAQLWRRLKLWTIVSRRARIQTFGMHAAVPNPASWNKRRARKVLEDETPLGADFSTMEYGKETKILEAPTLELLYYADAVGVVPEEPEVSGAMEPGADPFDIGNGDLPPEWGIDIAIRGGFLRYGPWADRQRSILQQTFFPPHFADATSSHRLKPGDTRMWTCMKVLIELRDGVTLQLPFREASKNWQWDGEVQMPNRPRKRDAASIHVRAGDNSTISYMMPMVATPRGYEPTLNVHLDTVTVTSSLNDIRLITAESCVVRCELPSPLRWNGQRQWTITITLRKPTLFLLRDHVNMFTDLGKDWASGPPADYHRFIPMLYMVDVHMQNYEINTYVNDHNIIDKPLLRDENALLMMRGLNLHTHVLMPFTKYRPASTAVSFSITAPDVVVSLTLPRWNTRSLYSRPHRSTDIGRIGYLRVDASYCFHAEVHPENIDQLRLEFTTREIVWKACGWTIRHFMILRNNYFGSFTHFSTLYEYLEKRRLGQPLGDPVDLQYREGSSNSLQVYLGLSIDSGLIVMPTGLRGYEGDHPKDSLGDTGMGSCVMMALPEMQLYLRTHDYFMEMSLNIDTISGSVHDDCSENLGLAFATQREVKETFVIDGFDILAHRLFGPQPHTTTYLCIWEFHIGAVKASLSTLEARVIKAAMRAFGMNFTDHLNAPATEYEIPSAPDVTFLKITLDMLNIVWRAGDAAVELALPNGFRMDTNDLAGEFYSKVTSFRIPHASLKLLVTSNTTPSVWHEALGFVADSNIDMYSAPYNWREKAKVQSEFLATQDSHTGRAMFLYMPDQSVPYDVLAPGRGILDTEFYLPQLRVPTASSRKSAQPPQKPAGKYNGDSSPHNVLRHLKVHSESEEEEWISEADRDARLAKSRPTDRVLVPDHDNESISSGDESDDDDLTQRDHSDSEPATSPGTVTEVWPSLQDHRNLVRRYESRYLDRPSLWSHSPYHFMKERIYSLQNRFGTFTGKPPTQSIPSSIDHFSVNFDATVDTTVTRVANHNGAMVWFTPLVLPATEELIKHVQTDQLSPELCFDNILADHVQSFIAVPQLRGKASVLDLNFASIQVSSVQSIQRVKSEAEQDEANSDDTMQYAESTADCLLRNLHLKLSTSDKSHSRAATCSFTSFVTGIGTTQAFDEACRFSVGPSAGSLENGNLLASFGDVLWDTSVSAVEHTLATAAALLRYITRLQTLASSYSSSQSASDLHMILRAIEFARDRTIVDPLSTTQPSYLIQSGRPHKLRTDILFKYLIHLRNSLQYLGPSERQALFLRPTDDAPTMPMEEIARLVESHLVQFGMDAQLSIIPKGSPLGMLVSLQSDRSSEHESAVELETVRSLSLKFSRVQTVLHSQHDICSEFSVEPFVVAFRTSSIEQSQAQIPSAAKSSTTLALARSQIRQLGLVISVGDVMLGVKPELIRYAQTVLRVSRRYRSVLFSQQVKKTARPIQDVSANSSASAAPQYYVDVVLTTRSLRFRAGAENLIIEYRVSGMDYTSTSLVRPSTNGRTAMDLSMNHSMSFKEIRLQASAVADMSKPEEYAILGAFVVGDGRVNTVFRRDPDSNTSMRIVAGINDILVNIPRSAMRLYRFMEEWRADYLPGIEAMVRSLLSELNQSRHKRPPTSPPSKEQHTPLVFRVDISIPAIRVSLQVMRGTWIAWEVGQIIAYFYSPEVARKARTRTFGLQIGSQMFMISSKAHSSDATPNVRVRLPLPTFSYTGKSDGKRIESLALIEYFSLTVKPSHWDTLLSVQQKFGQDFNDLVSLIAETRNKKSEPSPVTQTNPWKYRVIGKLQGFSIGLDGVSSTLFLACNHVGGAVSNDTGFKWHVELSDLALSLAPHSERREQALMDSHNRSAFVIIDTRTDMGDTSKGQGQRLDLQVTKIHAVMQPSSIGQLGDFIDHLQAEILIRKEQRAQDLAEFKKKTKTFMRTFELKSNPSQAENLSWLDRYIINVAIMNVGVAFPLSFNQDLRITQTGAPSEGSVRAFLFSIKSISFGTQRGESGQASMKGFSFQFVSRFRQNLPRDFSGETHSTRNRLLYPEMTAQLRSERSGGSRQLHISADVDGFILDIDSSIPDYISSLIEVYRQGKARVDRLAGAVPRNTPITEVPPIMEYKSAEQEYDALPTSNMFLSLNFRSGRVRMFSQAYAHASRTRAVSTPIHEYADEQIRELGAEIFKLPVVSVWGEYRATPASTKMKGKRVKLEPSTLVFKSTVHSSQNTLRPTLLPFFTEIVSHVEERMRKTSGNEFRSSSITVPVSNMPTPSAEESPDHISMPTSSMQISLSLRIDQSKLELTCQPDVNVVAGLNWDSGGFVVNISPGAHRVTFSGSVGGLTVGLKHGFLSEDCMTLHARNLAFTVDFAKARSNTVSSVSIVCDTEFSGGVRFSRLQDILCFKAVWLDRIPVFNVPAITPGSSRTKAVNQPAASAQVKQELTTLVLLRLRGVQLDIDLGQSISSVKLSLSNAVLRTRLAEAVSELSLSVHEVSAVASGNLTGHISVPDFLFQTTRRTDRSDQAPDESTMLDLRMTSGPLEIDLESEYQKLLLYRAEPLNIRISDNWALFSTRVPSDERRVRLTFTVEGSDIIAVTSVGTIPKLVSYGTKFKANLDAQKEGASRESQAFRISNSPKPDNALSEVANAMFNSARTKLIEAETGFSCVIGQRLSLKLKTLKLVIFPRSMRDPELAQFAGSDIHAQLDRIVESDALPPERELQLFFSSIAISKLTQLQYGALTREQAKEQTLDTRRWLTLLTRDAAESTIFSLPSMDMRMHSEEFIQDGTRVLPYDFSSKFVGKHGTRDAEDIYVTLNMSLYSWLTILRKSFAREMDQVRASTEVRMPTVGLVQSPARKRHVEPMSTMDREDTQLVLDPEPMSPVSPSLKRASLQHTRSLPIRNATKSQTVDSLGSLSSQSPTSPGVDRMGSPSSISPTDDLTSEGPSTKKSNAITYRPHDRHIERLTMRQLGEATPDVMHPFFMKTAGFNLEDSLPQYVHEYATMPTEEIMKALLKLYSKQLVPDSIIIPDH